MATNTSQYGTRPQPEEAFAIESRICQTITDVAQGDSPVLIAGEVGVGKSATAAEIHRRSRYVHPRYVQISAAECTAHLLLSVFSARAASTEVERQLMSEVSTATEGNRKLAANELGISYKALLYKLKQGEAHPRVSLSESGHKQ